MRIIIINKINSLRQRIHPQLIAHLIRYNHIIYCSLRNKTRKSEKSIKLNCDEEESSTFNTLKQENQDIQSDNHQDKDIIKA